MTVLAADHGVVFTRLPRRETLLPDFYQSACSACRSSP